MEKFTEFVKLFQYLIQPPWIYFWAIAIGALILLWIIHSYRVSHQGIIPFKSSGGSVEIAPQTLKGILQFAATRVKGVEKATCTHRQRGRGLEVRVAIHLRADTRLKIVETEIKRQIRHTLFEQFGMEMVEPIHIKVAKLIGDPRTTDPLENYEEATALPMDDDDDVQAEDDDDRPYETKV